MNFKEMGMFTLSEETKSDAVKLASEGFGVEVSHDFKSSGGTVRLSISEEGMIPFHAFKFEGHTFFVGLPRKNNPT